MFEPPPSTLPEWLEAIDDFVKRECFAGVVGAIVKLGAWARGGPTADAAGITGLSATNVCPGTKLSIFGAGFGTTQPNDVRVYVPVAGGGCREATVTAWSDTEVQVHLPADVGAGCVGFVRGYAEYNEPPNVRGGPPSCFGAVGEAWGRGLRQGRDPAGARPPCLPGGENRIGTAGRPVVNTFRFSPGQVEPGGQPVLSWSVTNAQSAAITRTSQTGPILSLPNPLPLSGTITLPPIGGLVPVTGTYRLEATNACGRSQRDATFTMAAKPSLGVSRIEVVQSIQTVGNTVRLTANRRTAVRAFVDSGIADPFDFGSGPARVAGIEVSVLAENLDDGIHPGLRRALVPPRSRTAAEPRPAGRLRELRCPARRVHRGAVRFRVTATLPGPVGAPPLSFATGSVDVSFEPKAAQEFTPFLINDTTNPLPPPLPSAILATLQGPMDAHPFVEFPAGFTINPSLTMTLGERVPVRAPRLAAPHRQAHDDDLPVPEPARRRDPSGDRPAVRGLPDVRGSPPACRGDRPQHGGAVGRQMCCVHELAHAFGLNHINSCGAPFPWDGGLPFTIPTPD